VRCASWLAFVVRSAHGTQKMFGVPGHPFSRRRHLAATMMGGGRCDRDHRRHLMLLRPVHEAGGVRPLGREQMAVAYFHASIWPHGVWPILNGGELAVLFLFPLALLSASARRRVRSASIACAAAPDNDRKKTAENAKKRKERKE